MQSTHNFLRQYRKRTQVTQFDVAFLLGLGTNAMLSRYENGQTPPNLEIMLTYSLLFNAPITGFFGDQQKEIKEMLLLRITELITMLKEQDATDNIKARIAYLSETHDRLLKETSA